MKRIGITGQAGFVGTYLFNLLKTKNNVTTIPFEDVYYENPNSLVDFVKKCDVIVHLAAVNRCDSPDELYETNIRLVNQLIEAMQTAEVSPHVIFSSSTQEERVHLYGKSKRDGREKLSAWAEANQALFTGLVIPNVYGPFGKPFYNSVVAPFCHQLTDGEQPKIDVDGTLNKSQWLNYFWAFCFIYFRTLMIVLLILNRLLCEKPPYPPSGKNLFSVGERGMSRR